MRRARLFFVVPLFFIMATSTVVYASAEGGDGEISVTTTTVGSVNKLSAIEELKFTDKPKALDSFWDKLARCETNSNWEDRGNWAGGLGIARSTWKRFGGKEFAPTPDKATKEEQIIVAHRISTQGYIGVINRDPDWAKRHGVPVREIYNQAPVGFGGWGALPCAGGKPKLYHYNPHEIVVLKYRYGQRGIVVKDLQTLINAAPDGRYGPKTRRAHLQYLKKHGLPTSGVPKAHPAK